MRFLFFARDRRSITCRRGRDLAVSEGLISEATGRRVDPDLGFRHFFGHAYAFQLDSDRIIPLVEQVAAVFADLRTEVSAAVAH
jgi:hypothetical protein